MLKSILLALLVICVVKIPGTASDDILGCSGYVKSDVDIDFSKVEIRLFTKQGSMKDHTDCAPNNGYYVLPVYDKGEYIVKVSSPEGWLFEPSEVAINVDGVSDPCTRGKDINFIFKGFAVTGKVISSGRTVGPAGITVELLNRKQSTTLIKTITQVGGDFVFSPVPSGSYIVKIFHSKWALKSSEVAVEVSKSNGKIPLASLAVKGYDVSGSAISDGQPITGVSFVLFSKTGEPIDGCDKSPIEGFSPESLNLNGFKTLCHVATDSQGVFSFPQVPPGDYILVPHYKGGKNTKFDVHPRSLTVQVEHDSVRVSTPFQVQGFTVSGRVLWSANGRPLEGASIILNGKEICKSGPDGSFTLESMRAGSYKILATADNVVFEEKEIKVSSTTLSDLIPSEYKVCGRLHSPSSTGPYRVDLSSEVTKKVTEVLTDASGAYCVFLPAGTYSVSPVVDRAQKNHGLIFAPSRRVIEVVNKNLENINFSQLKSTVKGKIVCMSVCPLITVNLKSRGQEGSIQTIAKGGLYEFKDVSPGDYDIYIEPGLGWCWDRESQAVAVIDENTDVPTFKQSGFSVTTVASHSTKVVYYNEVEPSEKFDLSVTPGSTHICVSKSTPYIFEPIGCHRYDEAKVRWTPGTTVQLNAVSHSHVFRISASHPVPDLIMNTVALDKTEGSRVPRLIKPTLIGNDKNVFIYEFELQMKEGEAVKLVPSAGIYLFYPASSEIKGKGFCVNSTEPMFVAEKGQVIAGKVTSADNKGLADVLINVVREAGQVILSQTTSPDGSYKFPPVKPSPHYKVIAEKEGYVLTEIKDSGNFNAHKLAEIIVNVKDSNTSESLQGVLLSLSGGQSYRKNAQTNAEGTMSFLSLSPGEYFLKPMMKEYRFLPSNKIINVQEGATVQISLSGERVAYSGFGKVVCLSGEGESGVTVEAVGLASCELLQEETVSTENGNFRIRGLKPNCEYNVRVKTSTADDSANLSSDGDRIKVGEGDIKDLKLYSIRPSNSIDVAVFVVPDRPEDLKTLRVRLSREDSPDTSVTLLKLSNYKSSPNEYSLSNVVVALPRLVADGRGYIIKLESSLSTATYEYTNRPIHFKANGSPFKTFRLTFSPRLRFKEPDLSASSYFALPLLFFLGLAFYNKDSLVGLATHFLEHSQRESRNDDVTSDQFLGDYPKKKAKTRKT